MKHRGLDITPSSGGFDRGTVTFRDRWRSLLRSLLGREHDRLPAVPTWHGPFSPGLWGELERALRYSRGKTPYDVLNRSARAKVRDGLVAALPHLGPTTATIRRTGMTAAELAAAFPRTARSHARRRPVDETSPIIAIEAEGRLLLVDGRTRINKWTSAPDDTPHDVLIVSPDTK